MRFLLLLLLTLPMAAQTCYTIRGTSTTSGSWTYACGTSGVVIPPINGVSVTGPTSLIMGGLYQYTAKINGGVTSAVTWQVNGITGGGTDIGTINGSGLYTAPPNPPTAGLAVTIDAINNANAADEGDVVANLAYGVPSQAVSSGILDGKSNWQFNHDAGTNCCSSGTMTYPVTVGGRVARQYSVTTNTSAGAGHIAHVSWGADTTAHHFIYDTYVYLANPTQMGQLEMDMNQVLFPGAGNVCPSGAHSCTQIFGIQCDKNGGKWDYTYTTNLNGSPNASHWRGSAINCDPRTTFTANTWYHIQLASHRDDAGNVIYDWECIDGTCNAFGAVANVVDSESLGWNPNGDLLLNFQMDAAVLNAAWTTYSSSMQVWRW